MLNIPIENCKVFKVVFARCGHPESYCFDSLKDFCHFYSGIVHLLGDRLCVSHLEILPPAFTIWCYDSTSERSE